MTQFDTDPFAESNSNPAISFKDAPKGTVHKITVTEAAKLVQSRDYNTGDLATWPDGNPKMSAVVAGTDENGQPCSLWAQKPSSMFTAIQDAQKAVGDGYRLKPGDVLAVQFYGDEPAKNPRNAPRKLYKAKIEKGAEPDAFASTSDLDAAPPF